MIGFAFGSIILIAFLGAAWWFSRQKTEDAARLVRIGLGGGALLAGIVLSLRGVPQIGGPIALFGLGMIGVALGRRRPQSGRERVSSGTERMSLAEAREVLGLDEWATADDIRKAHRSLMKKLHPDTGEGSAALARQVQEARDVLLDALGR